jgi:hypothetical protein
VADGPLASRCSFASARTQKTRSSSSAATMPKTDLMISMKSTMGLTTNDLANLLLLAWARMSAIAAPFADCSTVDFFLILLLVVVRLVGRASSSVVSQPVPQPKF